jgi:hypothetical protein
VYRSLNSAMYLYIVRWYSQHRTTIDRLVSSIVVVNTPQGNVTAGAERTVGTMMEVRVANIISVAKRRSLDGGSTQSAS